jgi:glycerol-3-phosphate dehydrogenase (NAD(P)+)
MMFKRIALIGTTAWGTTLAIHLANRGYEVFLGTRDEFETRILENSRENENRLPGVKFPENLHLIEMENAVREVDLVCFAVPSHTLADNAKIIAQGISSETTLLSATKGLEQHSGKRMSEILREIFPHNNIAVLSGPNLSKEVAFGNPTTTVIASKNNILEPLQSVFHNELFRVYTSEDVIGVELGGSLKNIIAFSAGMADHFEFGNNSKAAIITRGLAEITRLAVAAGAEAITMQGLAGMGDVIATSYSQLSRNRTLGESIASGKSLDDALKVSDGISESVITVKATLVLAEKYNVDMPITRAINDILHKGKDTNKTISDLLSREPKTEVY